MSSPANAVDTSDRTSWTTYGTGRMVVDLGAAVAIGDVTVEWATGSARGQVEVSTDGLDYTDVGVLRTRGRSGSVTVDDTTRYVAITVEGGRQGAAVRRLSVTPG